jgi:indole-3-glycerol phosphate synthase
MPTILDKIVATTRQTVQRQRQQVPPDSLRERLPQAPPLRDFFAAIESQPGVSLIAEVKQASPSKGLIRPDFDPLAIAADYARNGAACISVLTDEPYFQGRLEYLREIRGRVDTPLLRKDFIIDSYQLLEARVAGADAVLLIAECLEDCQLRALHNEAIELGMTPLVEFYLPENCQRVLDAGATLIGVNNRDLRTFETDLQHVLRLRDRIPADCLLVAESGIRSPDDVRQLGQHGVDAMLVGESLMAQPDVGAAVRRLLGRSA